MLLFLLLSAGFIARLFAFRMDYSFESDVHTFQFWAIQLFENGFSSFYGADFFSDYPPVYMYVLYLLGAVRAGVQAIFGSEYWVVLQSPMFRFFTFLPAILADLGIGCFIYKIAIKSQETQQQKSRNNEPSKVSFEEGLGETFSKISPKVLFALFAAAMWLFNPAIILISSVWGQVESVFVLMLVGSLYFLRQKKLIPAYVLFGLAIMTKPQSLFLAPVFLYSAYEFFQANKDDINAAVLKISGAAGAALSVMIFVSLPFGLMATMRQMLFGVGLYGHATVNAANLWFLRGDNWGEYSSLLFLLIVVHIVIGTMIALHYDSTRHGGRHFYLIVAALFVVIFAFSMRMHERYLFPALVFFVIYYIENRQRRELIFYWAFSALFFLNALEVLRIANADGALRFQWSELANTSMPLVALLTVLLSCALIFTIARTLFFKSRAPEKLPPDTLKEPPRMTVRDYICIGALVLVYSVLAFVRLGDMRTPQTTWEASANSPIIRASFGQEAHVSQFKFLMGARNNIPFEVWASICGYEWESVHRVTNSSVFAWHFVDLDFNARFIEIDTAPWLRSNQIPPTALPARLRLQEVAFRDADGEIIPILPMVGDPHCWCCNGAYALFDEQHLVPYRRSFMNSTYFDEIYHPRTGYEFVHGLPVFEWTHPPLGKVFMSWSIRAFGMTPFAWRLPGTLFGIAMIPLIYAFARKLLKSNNFALFTAVIFTFDFMLFSHTRLATIDSFVTFFVLAMYFAMYCYLTGIEKNSLGKSLVLLALCGAAMGLAVASKWQGVYGALGLPILFFPALWKLYKRDEQQALITFGACLGFFIIVPITIYILSYNPFVASSTGSYGFFQTILNNQEAMLNYHADGVLGQTHPFASDWWSWPLIRTPLFQYQSTISPGVRAGMSSLGNPMVWWFGIFATGFAIYSLAKKRRHERDTVFLLIAYAANFLPWIFITRLTFIYHYFPSVPFVVLLIALFFRHHVRREWMCFVYVGAVVALFILYYPVLSGMPISAEFINVLRMRWVPEGFRHWFIDWWLA